MKYFIVDAFTDALFGGNPAGICVPDSPLSDELMQSIAAENNLAETAFFQQRTDGSYDLRWFTPAMEIDLCGHATLGTAYVLSRFYDTTAKIFRFYTKSGLLTVKRQGELYEMDFPSRMPKAVPITSLMAEALGADVLEAYLSRDFVLLVKDEAVVRTLSPDMELLKQIPACFGVIVTANSERYDFVSRFFAPNAGIPEDPVTGSSHSELIPFWAKQLGKNKMTAAQLSKRSGILYCEDCGERVKISGNAALYLTGELHV